MLAINASPTSSAASFDSNHFLISQGHQSNCIFSTRKVLSADIHNFSRPHSIVSSLPKSNKKAKNLSKKLKTRTVQSNHVPPKDNSEFPGKSLVQDHSNCDIDPESSSGSLNENVPVASPNRSAVLQACVLTSGCLLALGAIVRQASHIAFTEGAPIIDATEVSFSFEAWHVEWIIGLVILISSCRYILLKTWPDFSESSEAANQQVLAPFNLWITSLWHFYQESVRSCFFVGRCFQSSVLTGEVHWQLVQFSDVFTWAMAADIPSLSGQHLSASPMAWLLLIPRALSWQWLVIP